jgi:serine/threonine-protein kinase RsbW
MSGMERSFTKKIESLEGIFGFLDECFQVLRVDEREHFSVKFAVEEIFTNMVKYNPEHQNDVAITLSRTDNELRVRLVDVEDKPFDIRGAKPRDHDRPLMERRPGGLGLHLTNRIMDNIEYVHEQNTSTITLVKRLEQKNV